MDVVQPAARPRRALGVYIIVAYLIFVGSTTFFWRPAELPLGWFTLEGQSVRQALTLWSAVLTLTVIGLSLRRRWGYRVAMSVFGLYLLIVGSNTLSWFAHNQAPMSIALQVAVWPMLQVMLPAMLALAYLYERSDVFLPSGRAS